MAHCTSRKESRVPQIDFTLSPSSTSATTFPLRQLKKANGYLIQKKCRTRIRKRHRRGIYCPELHSQKLFLQPRQTLHPLLMCLCTFIAFSLAFHYTATLYFPPSLPLSHLLLLPFLSVQVHLFCYNVVEIMDPWICKCQIIVLMSCGNKKKKLLLYIQRHQMHFSFLIIQKQSPWH